MKQSTLQPHKHREPPRAQVLDAVAPVYQQYRDIVVRAPMSHVSHFATCPAANQFSKKKENNK